MLYDRDYDEEIRVREEKYKIISDERHELYTEYDALSRAFITFFAKIFHSENPENIGVFSVNMQFLRLCFTVYQ